MKTKTITTQVHTIYFKVFARNQLIYASMKKYGAQITGRYNILDRSPQFLLSSKQELMIPNKVALFSCICK
jgi:hypothetical protein